ncbi:hypothetical protein PUV54_16020 [Hyphococcus flavus]|uniref:Uncharacterized protein n=1 Tax=Hyphococcus flavus TaxID=1866326 RepID=A0AAE9ZER1_9PROT|nr:hypothetical protein [Hyphococcus flavus]WDI31458.1 hypothetical protein PUV54_16020 [Hyphococcus flavus]
MTKAILGLLGLQTVLLLVLTFRIADLERIDSTTRAYAEERTLPLQNNDRAAARPQSVGLSAEEIREIVRSEMALAVSEITVAQSSNSAATPQRQPLIDERQIELMRASVEADLNAMRATGRSTPSEMAALQSKIAKLPPRERKAALDRLTKAINDGYIDAQL